MSAYEDYCRELRRLRAQAGNPSRHVLAKRTGYSDTYITNVLQGGQFCSWAAMASLVEALDGDPHAFKPLWVAVTEAGRDEPPLVSIELLDVFMRLGAALGKIDR